MIHTICGWFIKGAINKVRGKKMKDFLLVISAGAIIGFLIAFMGRIGDILGLLKEIVVLLQ